MAKQQETDWVGRMGSQVSGCGGVWTWGIGDPQKLKTYFLELMTSFLEPQVGRMLMGADGPSSGPSFLGEVR